MSEFSRIPVSSGAPAPTYAPAPTVSPIGIEQRGTTGAIVHVPRGTGAIELHRQQLPPARPISRSPAPPVNASGAQPVSTPSGGTSPRASGGRVGGANFPPRARAPVAPARGIPGGGLGAAGGIAAGVAGFVSDIANGEDPGRAAAGAAGGILGGFGGAAAGAAAGAPAGPAGAAVGGFAGGSAGAAAGSGAGKQLYDFFFPPGPGGSNSPSDPPSSTYFPPGSQIPMRPSSPALDNPSGSGPDLGQPQEIPPEPPFRGGQRPVPYNVVVRFRHYNNDGVTIFDTFEWGGQFWGPLAFGTMEPPFPNAYIMSYGRFTGWNRFGLPFSRPSSVPVLEEMIVRTGEWPRTEIISIHTSPAEGPPGSDPYSGPEPDPPSAPGAQPRPIAPPIGSPVPTPQPNLPFANPQNPLHPDNLIPDSAPDPFAPIPVSPRFPGSGPTGLPAPNAPIAPSPNPPIAPAPSAPGVPGLGPTGGADPFPMYDTGTGGDPDSPNPPTDNADPCSDPCLKGLSDKIDLLLELSEPNEGEDCCEEILAMLGRIDRTTSRTETEVLELTGFSSDGVFSSGCEGQDEGLPYFYTGTHFAGISAQIAALSNQLRDKLCRMDTNPAVPDWWQVRLGAGTPQLSIQFAEVADSYRPPKYVLNIPHPKFTEPFEESPISAYEKGNWMAILTLKDNSKAIVNCADMAECERVMEEIISIINPTMLTGLPFKIGTRGGRQLNQIKIAPKIAKYFSTGQMNLKPDWISYLS